MHWPVSSIAGSLKQSLDSAFQLIRFSGLGVMVHFTQLLNLKIKHTPPLHAYPGHLFPP